MHISNLEQPIIEQEDYGPLIRYLKSLEHYLVYSTVIRPYTRRRFHVTHHVKRKFFYSVTITNLTESVDLSILACLASDCLRPDIRPIDLLDLFRKYCCCDQTYLDPNCPTTAILVNFYHSLRTDRFLCRWCQGRQLLVTRYRNHYLFSANQPIGQRLRRDIRRLLGSSGFTFEDRRSRFCDRNHRPVNFFGIGLDRDSNLIPTKRFTTKLRGLLHRAITKRDVPPAAIRTRMGQFKKILSLTSRPPTKQEQRILCTYSQWKHQNPS